MYPHNFRHVCKNAILAGWLFLSVCSVNAVGLRPLPERALGFYPYNTIGRVVASDGTMAIGTAISERHVITSASVFRSALTDGASQVRWFPIASQSNSEFSATVKSATFAPGFLEAGSALQAFQHDLVILELNGDTGVAVHPFVNVGKLREKAYRKVVSLGAGLYLPGSGLREVIHATRNGEPAEATFQQVTGKLYQTNQLKGAPEGRGAPVFSFYDRNWSIDGWVAGYEASTGNLLVMENDATSFEFIRGVLAASNAKRTFPIEAFRSSNDFNSTTRGAIPLPLGHTLRFSINPGSDVDYHSVMLTETGTYRIESFGPLDVSGALLNRNQQLISSDDDSGGSLNYRIQSLLEPGEYFVKTSPYSAQERGDYGLSVTRIDDATPFSDDGFGPFSVMELALNSTRSHYRISTADEVDHFRIRVTAPGHFILWTESQLDTHASLLAVQPGSVPPFTSARIDRVLASNDDAPGRFHNVLLDALLGVGDYVVAIKARNPGEWGPYLLSTRFAALNQDVVNRAGTPQSLAGASSGLPESGNNITFPSDSGVRVFRFDVPLTGVSAAKQATGTTPFQYILYSEAMQVVNASSEDALDHTIPQGLPTGRYYLVLLSSPGSAIVFN